MLKWAPLLHRKASPCTAPLSQMTQIILGDKAGDRIFPQVYIHFIKKYFILVTYFREVNWINIFLPFYYIFIKFLVNIGLHSHKLCVNHCSNAAMKHFFFLFFNHYLFFLHRVAGACSLTVNLHYEQSHQHHPEKTTKYVTVLPILCSVCAVTSPTADWLIAPSVHS